MRKHGLVEFRKVAHADDIPEEFWSVDIENFSSI